MMVKLLSPVRVICLICITGLVSCNFLAKHQEDAEETSVKKNWKEIEELKNIDRECAAFSRDSGIRKAFLEYLDENGVLIRPNHYPLVGADALQLMNDIDDSRAEITWNAMDGDVSSSGDMGFTYGVFTVYDKQAKDTIQEGTYSMFWRKNKKGEWKIMVDSGSSGLGAKKDSTEQEPPVEK